MAGETSAARIRLARLGMGLAGMALAGRLVWLQVVMHPYYLAQADASHMSRVIMSAPRGNIYDRNGTLLAGDVGTYTVEVDAKMVEDVDFVARHLAGVLGRSSQEIARSIQERKANEGGRVFVAGRGITQAVAEKRGLRSLRGVRLVPQHGRVYPYGRSASHILGYLDADGVGKGGMEEWRNRPLAGTDGIAYLEESAPQPLPAPDGTTIAPAPFQIPGGNERVEQYPRPGQSIYLTIDLRAQQATERALARAVERTKACAAMGIVLDPRTGDILAMANVPDFHPAKPASLSTPQGQKAARNLAVSWRYEPGSTFKIFVMAAALNEGVIKPSDTFYCSGSRRFGDKVIKCWTAAQGKPPHGRQDVAHVLANSCNVGMMGIIERLGPRRFAHYVQAFGFTDYYLDRFPAEARGTCPDPSKVGKAGFARFAFGQGLAVTPLGLAAGACALANQGVLMRPRLVSKAVDAAGNPTPLPRERIGEVVTPQIAGKMIEMMVGVVERGTGKTARIPGVKVAGKTGTAQKAIPGRGYVNDQGVASFIAIAPAQAPRFVVVVVLDEPQGFTSGSQAAAPAAREILVSLLGGTVASPARKAAGNGA